MISTLYQFIPRATDSQDAVVVSFGQIHGGQNANVIPEQVTLEGTLRTLSPKVRERTIANIRKIVDGIGSVTGTRLELSNIEGSASVDNDAELTELVERVSRELLGPEHVAVMPRPSMGSEDFASYLEHVPGTMFRLGCAGDHGPWPGLHTPTFDVDEKCMAVGAKILARYVWWSGRSRQPTASRKRRAFVMSKIDFHRNDRPTVGIEIELGLVDAETMALTSAYGLLSARLTAEGHQDADATQLQAGADAVRARDQHGHLRNDRRRRARSHEKARQSLKRPPMRSDCGCGGARRIRFRSGASSGSRPMIAICSS